MAAIATMAFRSVVEESPSEVVAGNKRAEMQTNTVPRIEKVKCNRSKTGNSKYRKKHILSVTQ